MKKCLLVLTMCVLLAGSGHAQDLSGALSGTLGPGSYNVIDSIWVAAAQSLTLAPGTSFNFAGAFGFGVAGTLTAIGTEADSIKFIPATAVPFWKGIDFTAASGNTGHLEYCLVSGANTSGIFIDHAGPAINHCTFFNNSSIEMGGGAYSMYGTGSFANCAFVNNTALHGGGLVIRYTPVNVSNCVFTGNNATYGGAMAYYFSTVCTLTNCLFYGNTGNAGGGIRFSSSPVQVINCTFTGNNAASGSATFNINMTSVLKNCLLWGNTGSAQILVYAGGTTVTYSDVQDTLWPGAGNINQNPLFVAGPDGAYYLSQIAAGQGANSPCMNAGDPASAMITGTTRTDQVQDAGVVDMGYHYALGEVTVPNVTITLLPVNPPINIPPQGGSFNWDITLHNNATTPLTFDVWTIISGPVTRPGWGPFLNLTLAAGATINRVRSQVIVERYPPGNYTYTGNVGDYPDSVWDSDSFPFTKLLGGDDGWASSQSTAGLIPVKYALHGATPNPFNPTTTLSFALPKAGQVKLMVYNVSGQEVATLVNGWRDAGIHEVTFDASGMPSGVYLAQLSAANYSAVKAMMLLK